MRQNFFPRGTVLSAAPKECFVVRLRPPPEGVQHGDGAAVYVRRRRCIRSTGDHMLQQLAALLHDNQHVALCLGKKLVAQLLYRQSVPNKSRVQPCTPLCRLPRRRRRVTRKRLTAKYSPDEEEEDDTKEGKEDNESSDDEDRNPKAKNEMHHPRQRRSRQRQRSRVAATVPQTFHPCQQGRRQGHRQGLDQASL